VVLVKLVTIGAFKDFQSLSITGILDKDIPANGGG
jgi:hypothetical protein